MIILLADNDEDDCLLVRDALEAVRDDVDLRIVSDGEQLMRYLDRCCSARCAPEDTPCPQLVLLDINLPETNGIQALRQIRSNSALRPIPVILVTGTASQNQIRLGYECGANSFITKPSSFEDLVRILKNIVSYWLETVDLPREMGKGEHNPFNLLDHLAARQENRSARCGCPPKDSDLEGQIC